MPRRRRRHKRGRVWPVLLTVLLALGLIGLGVWGLRHPPQSASDLMPAWLRAQLGAKPPLPVGGSSPVGKPSTPDQSGAKPPGEQQPDAPAPPAPVNLTATLKPEGTFLTWQSGGGDVACWQVYRVTEAGSRTPVQCVPAASHELLDNPTELRSAGLAYEVTARDAAGHESTASNNVLAASARTLRNGWRGDRHMGARLLADLAAARPGQRVDFRPFDGDTWAEPGQVGVTTGQPARTLLFSDSPETVTQPGVLYQAEASGPTRIYFYHVNNLQVAGSNPTAHVGVIMTNKSGQPASFQITRLATGNPASPAGWAEHTRTITALWLSDASILHRVAKVVPNGESRLLDPSEAATLLGQDDLLHAIYDVNITGKLQVSVVMTPGDPLEAFGAGLKPLTPDAGHDRGTFPYSDVTLSFSWPSDGFGRLWLAPGPSFKNLDGVDAMTGKAAHLAGNYGVDYHLRTMAPVAGTLVINPLGGAYAGSIRKPGEQPLLSPAELIQPFDDVAVIGHYQAGQAIAFDWMPPALSSLPVRLLYIPDRP